MSSRVTVWLQEHFSFFRPEPLFKDLLCFLEGEMCETVLSTLSNDGSFGVTIESGAGKIFYNKTKGKIGKCMIEQVEFIPHESRCFSFTIVDNELSIVRCNGSDQQYSPQVSAAEQQELSVFMAELRRKSEVFLKTTRT